MHGDLAEEPQGPCLVAAFLAATGERQRTFGELERVTQTANPEVGLAQSEHRRTASHAGRFPDLHLIEQRQGLGAPPRQRIGQPQARGDPWHVERDMRGVALREGVFEHRDGTREIPLDQGQRAKPLLRHELLPRCPAASAIRTASSPQARPSAKSPNSLRQSINQVRTLTECSILIPKRSWRHSPSKVVRACLSMSIARR